MSSSPRATASKETTQNILMATVEFSLDNTEWKVALLSRNQLFINFKCLLICWSKNNFREIHLSQGLDWVFSPLSH